MSFKALALIYLLVMSLLSPLVIAGQKILNQNHNKGFSGVKKALIQARIIPDVLPDFTPKCFLIPSYGTGKHERRVALGNRFKTKTTNSRPSLRIYCPDVKATEGLTVALTDPDAPSRENPEWSEMCHWIGVVYIPEGLGESGGLEVEETDFDTDLVEYKPPGPPAKTGYHRYVFVLLEGDNTNLTAPSERRHWGTGKERHGVRDWAEKEGLNVIGANYFIEKNKKQ